MMRTPALLPLLIGLAVVSSGAYAQEFRIEDVAAGKHRRGAKVVSLGRAVVTA